MIVMPACSTGWIWHCLARETGRIGHLYSPGSQRGPWQWLPYAMDNGAFSCWDMRTNEFDAEKWEAMEKQWRKLIFWASVANQKPLWAIVPDVPGNRVETIAKWEAYEPIVRDAGIPRAIAVQDGMSWQEVARLRPDIVCVGGTTIWKWTTAEEWIKRFPRVHVLRCNSPEKLHWLESLGCESCDGTGWNRGDKRQTQGVEEWARSKAVSTDSALWPYACKADRKTDQETFF